MFYIKNFFLNLLYHPVKGSIFIFITVIMIFSISLRDLWQEKILSISKYSYKPNFYVLFSAKEDYRYIKQKIISLEQVETVVMIKNKILKNKFNTIAKNINADLKSSFGNSGFSGLQVFLNREDVDYFYSTIVSYIKRLARKSPPVFGQLNDRKKIRDKMIYLFKNWGINSIIVGIILFWLVFLFLISLDLKSMCYLIETYHRKSNIALKSLTFGLGILFLVFISIISYFQVPLLSNLIIIMAIFLLSITININKFVWKN